MIQLGSRGRTVLYLDVNCVAALVQNKNIRCGISNLHKNLYQICRIRNSERIRFDAIDEDICTACSSYGNYIAISNLGIQIERVVTICCCVT